MLTMEIKINGCIIGHIYVVNKGVSFSKKIANVFSDTYSYEYEFYHTGAVIDVPKEMRKKESKESVTTGVVEHRREDGAAVLVKKVMDDICKKIK